MKLKIDSDTLLRIKGVLEKQPENPSKVRIYIAGMG